MDELILHRVACWLLHSGIQIKTGPEAGAVAGWLDEHGQARFVYPEITGYYLTWLRFLADFGNAEPAVATNASRAVEWLYAISRQGIPLTRYFGHSDLLDWRNDAAFSFDIAMVLRGLALVKGIVPEGIRSETQSAFQGLLTQFVSPGHAINPYIQRSGASLPDRWSTRPGPFQMKTAGAILSSRFPLNDELKRACFNTFTRWRTCTCSDGTEAHASLYAVEGLILMAVHGYEGAWEAAARYFERCLDQLTLTRSDVVAQALRAGCLLRNQGMLADTHCAPRLEKLARILDSLICRNGAVPYLIQAEPKGPHHNAWSAMFAYQALLIDRRSPDVRLAASLLC